MSQLKQSSPLYYLRKAFIFGVSLISRVSSRVGRCLLFQGPSLLLLFTTSLITFFSIPQWVRARHHSLTEFTNLQSLRHSGHFKHQNSDNNSMELSDLKKRYPPGDDHESTDDNLGDNSVRKMRKIVSFSAQSNLSTVSDQPDATDSK